MRCPSCGTDNAPDSRFCGGCGARLTSSMQRVAPTQKISDDASFPQRQFTTAPGHGAPAAAPPASTPRIGPMPAPFAPSGPPVAQGSAPEPRAISSAQQPRASSAQQPRASSAQQPRASSAPPSVYGNPPAGPTPPSSPSNGLVKPVPRPRTAQVADDPSLAMPIVARRPWGLIAVVLLIDLGLAVAGGWMLSQGIGETPSAGGAAPRPDPLPSKSP